MHKQKNRTRNEAFTLIETLVSLVIISIITTLIYFCCSSAIRNINKARNLTASDFKLIENDKNLRKIINSISVPDWETDYKLTYTPNSISFSWVEGQDCVYLYEFDNGFELKECTLMAYKNGEIAGIRIEYFYMGKNYECSQLFSSIPFGLMKL